MRDRLPAPRHFIEKFQHQRVELFDRIEWRAMPRAGDDDESRLRKMLHLGALFLEWCVVVLGGDDDPTRRIRNAARSR
jgi:hypothetical protein